MDHARDAVARIGDHDDHQGPALHEPVGATVAIITPATASARLRAAREALGLTTADIAARTRITERHIVALDRGDLAALPGRPYVLGFVRSYARVVGLDEADLARLARNELDADVPNPATRMVHQFDVEDPAKTPSRLLTWLALALFLAVIAAGGVFWRSYYAPAADLPSLALPDPAPVAPAVQKPAAPPPVANGPVVFTARDDNVWVKFYDGHGQQLMQKVLAKGESYTVPADAFEPKVWTGRPEALTVSVGGRVVAPLSDHRGMVRDVAVTAQALLARPQAPATPPTATDAGAARLPATTAPVAPRHRTVHAQSSDPIGLAPLAVPSAAEPNGPSAPMPAATTTGGPQ